VALKVYQIGLGRFGRYGFEKFLGMEENLESADVVLEGICEEDREKLADAVKLASNNDSEVKGFTEIQTMYEHASKEEDKVLIYDAGPSELHAENITRSLNNGFYHIAEKPPSLTKDGFLNQKSLSDKRDVFWKVDFIERENPVVMKAKELLKDEIVEEIKIFRESSIGLEKMFNPVDRSGVKGGDVLDKMFHEIYLLDFLEVLEEEYNPKIKKVNSTYLMPKEKGSDSLMNIYGGKSKEIDNRTATGQTQAVLKNNSIDIELNSSWMGLSDKAKTIVKSFEGMSGKSIHRSEPVKIDDKHTIINEEARFFIIDGSTSLIGDMLNKKLYNLDTGEEIKVSNLYSDQLYRVLEKAVLDASESSNISTSKKTLEFSELIFNIRQKGLESCNDYYKELEKSRKHVESFVYSEEAEIQKK